MWASKGLDGSMYLKKGLQGVVTKVDIRMGPNEGKSGLTEEARPKCMDQGDDRNEGGTCVLHEVLCSRKVNKTTTIGHGGANCWAKGMVRMEKMVLEGGMDVVKMEKQR